MHKEDPQQPYVAFDNVQVTSKVHFLKEVSGPKRQLGNTADPATIFFIRMKKQEKLKIWHVK